MESFHIIGSIAFHTCEIWMNMEAINVALGDFHGFSLWWIDLAGFCSFLGCKTRRRFASTGRRGCFRTSLRSWREDDFNDILLEQSERLRCSEQRVDGLEREFRSFKAAAHSERNISDSLKTHGATIGFADAW
jgi:hypothetical protein